MSLSGSNSIDGGILEAMSESGSEKEIDSITDSFENYFIARRHWLAGLTH